VKENAKEYNLCYFLLEAILLGIFTCLDLLLFYILFEMVLIPMYFVIGIFGSRDRRIRASYLLFLYTLLSSIFMLVAILYLFFKTGTTNFMLLQTIALDSFTAQIC
jgi:NADH:ubiquinone oxidoreductase subunit 4 (subunit M)